MKRSKVINGFNSASPPSANAYHSTAPCRLSVQGEAGLLPPAEVARRATEALQALISHPQQLRSIATAAASLHLVIDSRQQQTDGAAAASVFGCPPAAAGAANLAAAFLSLSAWMGKGAAAAAGGTELRQSSGGFVFMYDTSILGVILWLCQCISPCSLLSRTVAAFIHTFFCIIFSVVCIKAPRQYSPRRAHQCPKLAASFGLPPHHSPFRYE
jgi:hypothetical protein